MKRHSICLLITFVLAFLTAGCFPPLFARTPTRILSSTLPVRHLWTLTLPESVTKKPILHQDSLIILSTSALYAIDTHSGEILWRHKTGWRNWSVPIVVTDKFVAIGADGDVIVFERQTGKIVWQANVGGAASDNVNSIDIEDNTLFVVGQQTYIEARRLTTGELLWEINLIGALNAGISSRAARLFVQDSQLFILGTQVHIIDAKTGKIKQVIDINPSGGRVFGNKLFGSNHIYDIPSFTQLVEYKSPTFKPFYGNCILFRTPLEIRDDVFYVPGYCGGVFALNFEGEILWRYAPSLDAESPVAFFQGHIYALSRAGQIHAIDALTGKNRGLLKTNGKIPGFGTDLSARSMNANDHVLIATFGNRQIWAFGE